ncbi:MAG: hypothetical protein ISP90_02160 [Nevskia sp.]|nr:hypothetical protein [Nevskia sp.]
MKPFEAALQEAVDKNLPIADWGGATAPDLRFRLGHHRAGIDRRKRT